MTDCSPWLCTLAPTQVTVSQSSQSLPEGLDPPSCDAYITFLSRFVHTLTPRAIP